MSEVICKVCFHDKSLGNPCKCPPDQPRPTEHAEQRVDYERCLHCERGLYFCACAEPELAKEMNADLEAARQEIAAEDAQHAPSGTVHSTCPPGKPDHRCPEHGDGCMDNGPLLGFCRCHDVPRRYCPEEPGRDSLRSDQHAPSGELAPAGTPSCGLKNCRWQTHHAAMTARLAPPSGEPEEEDIDEVIGREIARVRAERQKTHPDVECVVVPKAKWEALRADLAQATEHRTFLAAGWQDAQQQLDLTMKQRDQYLAELQQARAVVEAARVFCDTTRQVDYNAFTAMSAALTALDHSPAVGETQERL